MCNKDICSLCKHLTTLTCGAPDFECLYDSCLKNDPDFGKRHFWKNGKKADLPCKDFEEKDSCK